MYVICFFCFMYVVWWFQTTRVVIIIIIFFFFTNYAINYVINFMSYLIIIILVVKQFQAERFKYSKFDINIKCDYYVIIHCHLVLSVILFGIKIKSQQWQSATSIFCFQFYMKFIQMEDHGVNIVNGDFIIVNLEHYQLWIKTLIAYPKQQMQSEG